MALTRNREISYQSPVEFLEHITGKKVLSWRQEPERMGTVFHFTDKTMLYQDYGSMLEINNIVYEPLPKSICVSCGQDMHFSTFDWRGRCEHSLKHFWERVRKVYWHRYSKTK